MSVTSLFMTTKKWKQLKCPSAYEWINKMWYIQTMEYYLAIKRNEVLIYATTQMKLENIRLSERRQSQKPTYCMIYSYESPE